MSEEKSIITKSAEKFSEHYSDNPVTALLLTGLSIVVPQIALGKEVIDRAVSKIQKERFQTLLDELATGEKWITPELVETEEFIHSFVTMYRAAMNSYQREKIRRFARILLTAIEKDELATDKFEEYVRTLESLSERELKILFELYKEESEDSNIPSDEVKWKIVFVLEAPKWNKFQVSIQEKYKLTRDEAFSILNRMVGLGLYILNSDVGNGGYHQGRTTKNFNDFSEWIRLEDEKLNADG